MLRRALEAAQTELLQLRSEPAGSAKSKGQRNRKGRSKKNKKKKRGWFSRSSATSIASASAGASASSIGRCGSQRRLTAAAGLVEDGTGGASAGDLRPDGALLVDPNARRYTRREYKMLRAALAAPTATSCRIPLDDTRLLARVLTFLPFREVRSAPVVGRPSTTQRLHCCAGVSGVPGLGSGTEVEDPAGTLGHAGVATHGSTVPHSRRVPRLVLAVCYTIAVTAPKFPPASIPISQWSGALRPPTWCASLMLPD